ncbi:MAG: endonuclease III [Candidatus Aenigmarchaeota archaeon]|nr:endonuclease III [Candidatus Aenigmarchaeota archaeon]
MTEKTDPSRLITLLEKAHGTEPWNWHTRQDAFQVLIGTVLSQRTKDVNTDRAARALFSRYPTPDKLSKASLEDVEKLIRPANYYRTKARKVREIARIIAEEQGGRTPKSMEDLVRLPGVGRKTASCTLLYGHGIGRIPVDVHVQVISQRLGWTDEKDPDRIQEDLERKLPKKEWCKINELLVKHGQAICLTRSPRCWMCPVVGFCRYPDKSLEARK